MINGLPSIVNIDHVVCQVCVYGKKKIINHFQLDNPGQVKCLWYLFMQVIQQILHL